jgi:hypothetical protein
LLLRAEFAGRAFVGSEQFLYWDAVNPAQCVVPDVMVRLGVPDAPVASWKVWEGGAPHVAVAIVSPGQLPSSRWRNTERRPPKQKGDAALARVAELEAELRRR